jgi:hypothetical protein
MVAAAYQLTLFHRSPITTKGVAMRRLSRILVALGGALSVACSAEPSVAPTAGPRPSSAAPDPKLVEMIAMARNYLKNLNDGIAGTALTKQERRDRVEHVTQFVKTAEGSIASPATARLRIVSSDADAAALADVIPTPETGGEMLLPIFIEAGTFTDLCLACQTATGFVATNYLGIITSLTQATINVGGSIYNPSSGNVQCLGYNCMSQVNLAPIVDCRQRPASGTASSTGIYFLKLKIANVELGSKNTYASGECAPPNVTVTLGSSSISVGSTTQATSTCVGFVQWASGTPSVATVDASGIVRGVGSGVAEISATCNSVRGSAMIDVHLANTNVNPGPAPSGCDDPMTPAVEDCDNPYTQTNPPYSVTYTRPGYYGEADDAWFTQPEFTETYTVVCDVTDWYEWNSGNMGAHYVGTDVNSCWLEPYNGGHH